MKRSLRASARAGVASAVLALLTAPVFATTVPDLPVDRFDIPFGPERLAAESAGMVDPTTGQTGVTRVSRGDRTLGGERDMRFWAGYGTPGESWTFGVDPARGLFWDNDPGMHVNTYLEWDGAGDGSTRFDAEPTDPLSLDVTDHRAFRLSFGSNAAPLEVQLQMLNIGPGSPCGAACGFVEGWSRSPVTEVAGDQTQPFDVLVAFADFDAPAAPFLPAADLSRVNVIGAFVLSGVDITGNELELRSLELTPVPVPPAMLLFGSALGALVAIRRQRRWMPR
ncbi:MAG: hypothetical protein AAFX81_03885 [Pseudomonadota bacterium]